MTGATGDAATAALIAAAHVARHNAYAPYSGFSVGAAVLTGDGQIHSGCNLENASYGLSLCAEAGALAATAVAGQIAQIRAIAIVGGPAGSPALSTITPCGRCRQMLAEAQAVAEQPIAIYCAGEEGDAITCYSVDELLPHGFGAAILNRKED